MNIQRVTLDIQCICSSLSVSSFLLATAPVSHNQTSENPSQHGKKKSEGIFLSDIFRFPTKHCFLKVPSLRPLLLLLTFRNLASYIQDGRKITLQMPHFTFIQQISVPNILNMLYNLHFSSKCRLFHNANLFGFCITHILNTGYAKI